MAAANFLVITNGGGCALTGSFGCRLSLKIDWNLEGSLSVATWDDTAWIGGTTSGTSYRSVALTKILIVNIYIVLKSLHWLKINERVKYKLLSVTYKVLTTNQPQYLYNLISVQPCHYTRFSSMVILARPPTHSSLKVTNRSF